MRSDLARVGLVVLIGVSALITGLRFLWQDLSDRGHYLLYVQFEDARNLSRGASVLMAGVQVGYVRAVNLVGTPPRAELTLSIQESVKIPRGSTFRISGGALLPADARVEIIPPQQVVDYLPPESHVKGETPMDFNAALSRLTPELEKTLQEFQRTLASARTLLEDEALRQSVTETLRSVQRLSEQSAQLASEVESLVRENRAAVRQLLRQANAATQELQRTLQSVNRLLNDPQLNEDVRATLASARASAQRTEQILKEVEQLIGDPQLQENLKQTAQNARTVSEKATTLADKAGEVLDNANTLTQSLNDTVQEARPLIKEAGEAFQRLNDTFERVLSLQTLGIVDSTYRIDLNYNARTERYRTDLLISLTTRDQRTLWLGIYDFTETDRLIAQLGVPLSQNWNLRYGLYGSKPGFGMDYRLGASNWLSLDIFDPNDWQGSLRWNWQVSRNVWLWGGLESPFRQNQPAFGVSIQR
jgi:phospholipid/cholesterol/gamma-HCH transport system substrate-binding protein